MGWTEYYPTEFKGNGEVNRKVELDKRWTAEEKNYKWSVLKSSMVGRIYYGAINRLNKNTGESYTFGLVCVTSVRGRYFSYKDMSEDMHPYYYDCPISILNLLSETDCEHSNDWRNACREVNESKKKKRKIQSQFELGDKIKTELWYEGARILTLSNYRGRKVWIDWDNRVKYKKCDVFKYPFEIVGRGDLEND